MSGLDKHTYDNGFSTPNDYFAISAKALQNRMEWLEEHKAFPALKMAWRESVFAIPNLYFEKAEVKAELLPYATLHKEQGKEAFGSPEIDVVNSSAIRLEAYKNLQVFEVPSAYFAESENKLKLQHSSSGQAKVISLQLRRFSFAAAAALVITAGWWAYSYFNQPIENNDCGGIACVDRNEILQVKNLEMLDDDQLLDVVNASALEKALQKNETKLNSSDSSTAEDELLDAL